MSLFLARSHVRGEHDGRVFPVLPKLLARRRAGGRDLRTESLSTIFNSDEKECAACGGCTAQGRGAEIDMCSRCSTPIPHPALAAASLLVHGKWVRHALPWVERLIRGRRLPERLLTPARSELVQIQKGSNRL